MLTIYSKNDCPYCDQAKKFLDTLSIQYKEVKVDEDMAARDFVVSRGHRSVPQIYIGEDLFVQNGFTGLRQLNEDQIKEKIDAYSKTKV